MKRTGRVLVGDMGWELPAPFKPSTAPQNFGPNTGYDSEKKKAWRDEVWGHLAGAFYKSRSKRPEMQVFLIESLDGLEIEKALSLGFSEENLHVCNANPAIVATLKRRYRNINTYGVSAHRALLRIHKQGTRLDIASLDFCSCLSVPVLETIHALRPVLRDEAAVAVNVLRGRERKEFLLSESARSLRSRAWKRRYVPSAGVRKSFKRLSDADLIRHAWVLMALAIGPLRGEQPTAHLGVMDNGMIGFRGDGATPHRRVGVRSFGIYKSWQHLTMSWMIITTTLDLLYTVEEKEDRPTDHADTGRQTTRHQMTGGELKGVGFLV